MYIEATKRTPETLTDVVGRDEAQKKYIVFYTCGGEYEIEKPANKIDFAEYNKSEKKWYLSKGWYEVCQQDVDTDEYQVAIYQRDIVEWMDATVDPMPTADRETIIEMVALFKNGETKLTGPNPAIRGQAAKFVDKHMGWNGADLKEGKNISSNKRKELK